MFLTTKIVELIDKKQFVTAALNPDHKLFIVHITAINISFDVDN